MAANVIEVRLSGGGPSGGGGGGRGGSGAGGGGPASNPREDRFTQILKQVDDIYDDLAKGAKTASEAFRDLDKVTARNRDFLNEVLSDLGVMQKGGEAQNFFAQRMAGNYNASPGREGTYRVAAPYTNTAADNQNETNAKAAEKAAREAKERAEKDSEQAERDHLAKLRTISQLSQQVAGGSAGQKVGGIAGLGEMAGLGAKLGAGGAEALAFAAGPEFAAAVAVSESVKELVRLPYAKAREGLDAIGNVGQQIASGDSKGLRNSISEGVAKTLETAGVAGQIAAEGLRTLTAAVNVAGEVFDAFAERGKEIAQYNSGIGGAAAEQNVARLRADIEEANRLGPDYQRVIRAQTQIEGYQNDVMQFVKGELLGALAEIAEPVGEFLRETKGIRKAIFGTASALSPLKTFVSILPPVLLLKLVNKLLAWLPGADEKESNGLLDELQKAAQQIPIGALFQPQPPAAPMQNQARPPLFPNL